MEEGKDRFYGEKKYPQNSSEKEEGKKRKREEDRFPTKSSKSLKSEKGESSSEKELTDKDVLKYACEFEEKLRNYTTTRIENGNKVFGKFKKREASDCPTKYREKELNADLERCDYILKVTEILPDIMKKLLAFSKANPDRLEFESDTNILHKQHKIAPLYKDYEIKMMLHYGVYKDQKPTNYPTYDDIETLNEIIRQTARLKNDYDLALLDASKLEADYERILKLNGKETEEIQSEIKAEYVKASNECDRLSEIVDARENMMLCLEEFVNHRKHLKESIKVPQSESNKERKRKYHRQDWRKK